MLSNFVFVVWSDWCHNVHHLLLGFMFFVIKIFSNVIIGVRQRRKEHIASLILFKHSFIVFRTVNCLLVQISIDFCICLLRRENCLIFFNIDHFFALPFDSKGLLLWWFDLLCTLQGSLLALLNMKQIGVNLSLWSSVRT